MAKNENLKERISNLKKQMSEIRQELDNAYKECEHNFEYGYTLETVIYCTICDRDATDIFPNMSYKHIEKLVEK